MELEGLLNQLDELGLPKDQYAITSSGPLAVRGIRPAKDLDLVVSDNLWQELIGRYPVKDLGLCQSIQIGEIEILGNFKDGQLISSEQQITEADIINSHRYVNLDTIIKFKKLLSRDKDLADIKLIEEYLAKQ
ncbi:MAG: hypothetical protein A2114_01590 [Candidatus Vogelbacteria bacterium GWA1_51_14]|uniref:Polymerase nucleotidyl transferase domain-containing protein n=1 Tax=Candidatus Vogelbacteria bacterium GWA1_51_14 TaxID=1802435 RepID=A0A1G2QAN2_9BACT|nr:MAG: hypothetical protein A2114_01590 [Candidatus Vogelbacteria bacterium GWA1_51_14]